MTANQQIKFAGHVFIAVIRRIFCRLKRGEKENMKYVRQFLLILAISFIGELLKYVLPLPIPASIYGMAILFAGLMTGLIKLEAVKDTGKFLIEIMPLMFIPAGVGLMVSWGRLKPVLVPVCVVTVVTIITVMAVTGRVSQFVIRRDRKRRMAGADKTSEDLDEASDEEFGDILEDLEDLGDLEGLENVSENNMKEGK